MSVYHKIFTTITVRARDSPQSRDSPLGSGGEGTGKCEKDHSYVKTKIAELLIKSDSKKHHNVT